MLEKTIKSCGRQKKGKTDNCAICRELDNETYCKCETKGGSW